MCGGACTNTDADANNCGGCGNVCPSAASYCRGGSCAPYCYPADQCYTAARGSFCTETTSDPENCGGCGSRCLPDEVCDVRPSAGGGGPTSSCQRVCDVGLTTCGRACVNTQIDLLHCGSCSHACGIGEYCVGGVCAHPMPH